MFTDEEGLWYPDHFPAKKALERILSKVKDKSVAEIVATLKEMTAEERQGYLFFATQLMQIYLLFKQRARDLLATGLSAEQIADELNWKPEFSPEWVAQIALEPDVRRLCDAGLTGEQIADQLDIPGPRVTGILAEIEREQSIQRRVYDRREQCAIAELWGAIPTDNTKPN